MNRIIDFYKLSETLGGVQTMFDELSKILPRTKPLSFFDVAKAFRAEIDPYKYTFFELDISYLIDMYLKVYERIFKPDFIIKNSTVGTFFKINAKQICVLQDNNIRGPKILYDNNLYDVMSYIKFRKSYVYLQKTTIENSDVCVAVSKNIANDYRKEFGVKPKVIYNGIDTDLFKPMNREKLREKYGIPKDKQVGISIQKYHPIKGWHIVAELIKTFPEIYWVIVFTQKFEHNKIKAKNVKLFYNLSRKQMAEIYNTANFSIQPSACESFNLCTAEAMSCGIPVIVSNTGFINDLGKTGLTKYGFVVDEWNEIKKYEEAIYTILNVDRFKPRKVIVDKFNKEIWRRKWQNLIKKI
ncbi:MAG: glycosyltransferase family 4 protein [Candidatus Heimdallarchaeaceae archaeon]